MHGNTKKETIILSDNTNRIRGSYFARRIFTYLADFFKNSRMDIVYRRPFYFDVRRMRNGTYRVRYGNALDDIRANCYIIADSNRRHGHRYHSRVSCRYFRQKNRLFSRETMKNAISAPNVSGIVRLTGFIIKGIF